MQNYNQVANAPMKSDEKNVTVEGNDDEGDMIKCDVCSYKDQSQTMVNLHKRRYGHTKDKYLRKHCPYSTGKKKMFYVHRATHVKYSCEVALCDFTSNVFERLKAHMTSHSQERNFICKICQTDLKHASSLTKHVNAHIRTYDCDKCDKQYKYPENLHKHKAKTHGVGLVKTHHCEYCTYNSTRGDRVKKHMKSKHPRA